MGQQTKTHAERQQDLEDRRRMLAINEEGLRLEKQRYSWFRFLTFLGFIFIVGVALTVGVLMIGNKVNPVSADASRPPRQVDLQSQIAPPLAP